MKKSIFLAVVYLSIAYSATAQTETTDDREQMHIGIKAGINYSNVYDTESKDFTADGKVGFAGGVFLSIPIGKFIGVQPEVQYSQKGFTGKGTILGSAYTFTRSTDYIEVPILFMIKPIAPLALVLGPQFSFLTKRTDTFTNAIFTESQQQEFNNENVRKNILGVVVGADFTFTNILVGVRGTWDIQNNNGDGTSNTPRYKNAVLQATVGLRF